MKLFAIAALAAALGLPTIASADVIDDFTIVGNGLDITFSLPATTLAYLTTPHSYWDETFPEIRNGIAQTGSLHIAADPGSACDPTEPSYLAGIGACGALGGHQPGGLYTVGNFEPAPGLNNAYAPWAWNPGTYQITDYTVSGGPSCPAYEPELTPYCAYPQYTITITPETTPTGATPEPGTLALLSTGLAGGWGVLRRRNLGKRVARTKVSVPRV